jgi:serine protease Do
MKRVLGVLVLGACLMLEAVLQAQETDERFLAPYVFIATGSGVIVSTDGDILTNFHVVAEVCSPLTPALMVRLPGVGEVAAVLVAADPVGDIALVHLTGTHPPLIAAPLAERIPPPGTPVVAVGNPFGLGDLDDRPSVSRGVLGTGRVVRGTYADCLQHDAPVNPGNSGGPLFDHAGQLLGINGAIRSRSGFRINSGIGLAVAAPQLALFLPALRRAGQSHGGWLWRSATPIGLTWEQRTDGVTVLSGVSPLLPGDIIARIAERRCPAVETARGLFNSEP